jgi:hypothetical protein
MRVPESAAVAGSFTVVWSQRLGSAPRGLVLAREAYRVLAWDDAGWVYLFTHAGARQGQTRIDGKLTGAGCAEDGSVYAVVTAEANLLWLAPDLTVRWQTPLPAPGVSVALDALGNYVAAADQRSGVHLFDARGRSVTTFASPRPLHHLAFVPAAAALVASADYGLVGSFDLRGEWRWRDGLVAHVGGLAVDGDGTQMVLACFSEGLRRYAQDGTALPALALPEPCRLVAQAYDGGAILVAGMSSRLWLVDKLGAVIASHNAGQSIAAAALGARAEFAVVALADSVSCLAIIRSV